MDNKVQIVISLPEKVYNTIIDNDINIAMPGSWLLCDAIRNGTLLEKHGNLKDVDKLQIDGCITMKLPYSNYHADMSAVTWFRIANLPTIIKASEE